MKRCPNPQCAFLTKHGYPAEYQDRAASCSDCGAALTAMIELAALPPLSPEHLREPRGVPLGELGPPTGEAVALEVMPGERALSIVMGVGLVGLGLLCLGFSGRELVRGQVECMLVLMSLLGALMLLLGVASLKPGDTRRWTVRAHERGFVACAPGTVLALPWDRLLRFTVIEEFQRVRATPIGWRHVLTLRWDQGALTLSSFEPFPGLLHERRGDAFQTWLHAHLDKVPPTALVIDR